MKGMLAVLLSIALTAVCWGIYGPVLHQGQHDMGAIVNGVHVSSQWRPFTCVGLAYFGIAVVVPILLLRTRGEAGNWSVTGTVWSLAAGAAGAIGALGIIMAFQNHGNPIYVMPLVFGGAPVVNTFLTMYLGKSYKEAGPIFFAGLILVVTGAATVLIFKPGPSKAAAALTASEMLMVASWVTVTAICWGIYGPVLHKGQIAMQGSRLRPFICVGLAYFLIAVILPLSVLSVSPEPGSWTNLSGTAWSLIAGSAGAFGALGIILAFTNGGKPVYVMPLVFGGAPVVNTLTTMLTKGSFTDVSPVFFAGLILVAVGAVTVLVFAPKGGHKPAPAAPPAKPAAAV
jgi:drug/metabolite transporter (DMT)-like permease